jgi:NAD(P)-dependent dehydrogenase (short-subunit alcohol dehydrogenase family)
MAEVAVITGASSGIGRATALALHEAGFDVIATMRNPAAGQELPCRVERLDVTDDASVDDLFDRVGPVDVLVNNAGVGGPGSCEETTINDLRDVMEANFFGAVRCTKKVIKPMREAGRGCIVNVTSVAGRVVAAMQSAYTASKFALEGWSESLAEELIPFGVRVAIVEPGVVFTPIFDKDYRQPSRVYAPAANRLVELLFGNGRHGTVAAHAAQTIVEAITTDDPRLRWLVGPDAKQLVDRSRATSDEERLAIYSEIDDDAFWNRFLRVYGPVVTPIRPGLP